MNSIEHYKNQNLPKKLIVSIAIKFALQEGVLYRYITMIRSIKPYKKGNDDIKFVMNYALGLAGNYYGEDGIKLLFVIPFHFGRYVVGEYEEKWFYISGKWQKLIGAMRIKKTY